MVDSTITPPAGRRLAALGHDMGAQARLDASASPCVVKRTALGKALEHLPQSRKRPGYARRRIRTREIVESNHLGQRGAGDDSERPWNGERDPSP